MKATTCYPAGHPPGLSGECSQGGGRGETQGEGSLHPTSKGGSGKGDELRGAGPHCCQGVKAKAWVPVTREQGVSCHSRQIIAAGATVLGTDYPEIL